MRGKAENTGEARILLKINQTQLNKMLQGVEDNRSNHAIRPTSRRPKSYKNALMVQPSVKTSIETTNTVAQPAEAQHKECRICLDQEETSSNPLLAPCKCQGSVKYVHDSCYRKWLERIYRGKDKKMQEEILNNGVQCEICKEKILLNFDTTYNCATCLRFKEKVTKNKSLFILFLIFILLNSGTLGYLAYYTVSNKDRMKESVITLSLIIGSFIFLGLTLVLTLFYFISDYIVDKTWELKSYEVKKVQKKRPMFNSRYQVAPVSVQQLEQSP